MSFADTLEHGGEPHPGLPALRRAAYALVAVGVIVFVAVSVFRSIDRREQRASFEHKIPSGRLGVPEDIARVVRFLLSDEAAYINGAAIVVDGGVTAVGGQEALGG